MMDANEFVIEEMQRDGGQCHQASWKIPDVVDVLEA
jgi:hypothetical protein